MSWENIRQEIQSHYTAAGYGILSKISGKFPYSVPGISSMKLMGIDSDRLWEIFFQKAIPLGLLEVYIDSDRAGGDEAGPSRRVDRVRSRGETIADEVIDNPDSDDDEEYIPSNDDIDTEEHWIHEMQAEAGERGISYKSNGPLAVGTVVDVVYATEPPNLNVTSEETLRFKYAFWAFAAAIHGLEYCMPRVTVDGTHLYGKYKGHLLLAVAMNGLNIVMCDLV
ncbi:unnamed protein product [Cuscuta campestris]|uniref:Uncharacterized protein n=1 Tax=Cuscuta campestris TaxID=132261 RepID=A0A484MP45_9ASTE|nr:unnamed protein product [Cuscuta campestris]